MDLRNYLERIYNVPVAAVRTRVQHGACPGWLLHCCGWAVPTAHVAHALLSHSVGTVLDMGGNQGVGAEVASQGPTSYGVEHSCSSGGLAPGCSPVLPGSWGSNTESLPPCPLLSPML